MKLRLIKRKPEAGDVQSLIFEADQPVSWQAGQYLHYVIPGTAQEGREDNRWFTISAAPSEGRVMLSTRFLETPSLFKQKLRDLQVGDEVEADGPEGDFTVDDPKRNYLFIAGGIGITPYRSILTEAAHQSQDLHVHLLYAGRDDKLPFRDELETLAAKNTNLKISYIIQPQRIDAELLKTTLAGIENPCVYVSGPEPMVEAMEEQLKALGVSEDNIKGDYFPGYEAE